jgi:phytol kinase
MDWMVLILSVLVVFVLLCVSEVWWRKTRVHNETSRKFVHVTVGSFVAFWPFFLSWHEIELLSLAFLVVVAISRHFHLFRAIHSVQRPTWGELFFAIAVGSVALISQNKWIYMTALLQMSLADGLAAVMGLRFGRHYRYKVLGQTKSIVGTVTFLVISFITLIVYSHYSGVYLDLYFLTSLSIVAALVENIGVFGIDNLIVPLIIALALRFIS